MNFLLREIVKKCTVHTKLVKIDNISYELHVSTSLKSSVQKFCPGSVTDITTADGRRVKNIFEIEGNKLIETQIETNRTILIVREFFTTEMLGEIHVGKIVTRQKSSLLE